jgi:N4-(beta-N-acetylglucosaminyl)-L-asparaginase
MHPKDAGLDALKRIKANTVEKRLVKANGDPSFNINFYVLSATGEHAGVSMYAGPRASSPVRYAVCTESGAKTVPCEPLLPGTPSE